MRFYEKAVNGVAAGICVVDNSVMADDELPITPEECLKERLARGWSQEDLAQRIGRTQGTISNFEEGKTKQAKKTAVLIAKAFLESAQGNQQEGIRMDDVMRRLERLERMAERVEWLMDKEIARERQKQIPQRAAGNP